MCFDATTSITTFSITLVTSTYLYYIEKNNKNNKFWAVITFLIGLMQLLEFFLWKNQNCNFNNHIFSLLILVLITLQPIVCLNYYNYLFNPTIFNKPFVIGYSILYAIFSLYILIKLNKFKLCSKPTKKSCRLNWDSFNKLSKEFPRYIGLFFCVFYFIPPLLIGIDMFINNKKNIFKYPIRHAFLPVTFLITFIYVCIKHNIFKKIITNPFIYLENIDIWGSMWCFMAVFLGIICMFNI